MARRYDSFVLRCWRLGDDACRIEVEHLQTAERTRVAILAAAVDWIGAQCGEARPEVGAEEVSSRKDQLMGDERPDEINATRDGNGAGAR